jgi:hypothetical protein
MQGCGTFFGRVCECLLENKEEWSFTLAGRAAVAAPPSRELAAMCRRTFLSKAMWGG